jgi:uncharacterized membrane protein
MSAAYVIVLRIVHIGSAVFWAGTIFFFALFFLPRIKALGPEGGGVMQRITAPPFPAAMTWAAALTALSGVLLYWRSSGGFRAEWVTTGTGLVLAIGGLSGLFAFLEGLLVSRPTTLRIAALGRAVAAAGGPPTPAQGAELQTLAAKLERALYRGAYLLLAALVGMAAARYL